MKEHVVFLGYENKTYEKRPGERIASWHPPAFKRVSWLRGLWMRLTRRYWLYKPDNMLYERCRHTGPIH